MAKFNDKETQSIAATVSDVLEGKVKKEDKHEFKPHMMYDPKTGKGYKAEKPEDHERMKKLGYVHEKPKKVDEVEQPRVPSDKNGPETGEVDFKKKHAVKKSGMKNDGSNIKEGEKVAETAPEVEVDELSDKQKKYQEFFTKALKRFKVKSPAELDKEGRKKFFDYVDKNYDAGENEED